MASSSRASRPPDGGRSSSATMLDVAKRAKCSRAAVSHVLMGTGEGNIKVGEKTAARVRRAAEELNFQPNHAARQLAGKGSALLGVIADPTRKQTQPHPLLMSEGIYRCLPGEWPGQ